MKTYEKGNLSESMFASKLLEFGYNVLIPFGGGHRYDLVIEKEGKFYSVQVKTGRLKESIIEFNSCSNNKGCNRESYHGQVDYIGVYCIDDGSCYLVPVEITGKSMTTLRLTPTKNNMQKGVNYAKDYLMQV